MSKFNKMMQLIQHLFKIIQIILLYINFIATFNVHFSWYCWPSSHDYDFNLNPINPIKDYFM